MDDLNIGDYIYFPDDNSSDIYIISDIKNDRIYYVSSYQDVGTTSEDISRSRVKKHPESDNLKQEFENKLIIANKNIKNKIQTYRKLYEKNTKYYLSEFVNEKSINNPDKSKLFLSMLNYITNVYSIPKNDEQIIIDELFEKHKIKIGKKGNRYGKLHDLYEKTTQCLYNYDQESQRLNLYFDFLIRYVTKNVCLPHFSQINILPEMDMSEEFNNKPHSLMSSIKSKIKYIIETCLDYSAECGTIIDMGIHIDNPRIVGINHVNMLYINTQNKNKIKMYIFEPNHYETNPEYVKKKLAKIVKLINQKWKEEKKFYRLDNDITVIEGISIHDTLGVITENGICGMVVWFVFVLWAHFCKYFKSFDDMYELITTVLNRLYEETPNEMTDEIYWRMVETLEQIMIYVIGMYNYIKKEGYLKLKMDDKFKKELEYMKDKYLLRHSHTVSIPDPPPGFSPIPGGKNTKKMRRHKGINQITGKLKKGYKYSGKKLKNGSSQIIKVKKN